MKKDYEKYRWFFTSLGKLVIGGKNAEQNEEIMTHSKANQIIFHTSSPGSPFCIIENPTKEELEEVAIFTACFSQQWKQNKKNAEMHIFQGNQVKKTKDMKIGTFGISGKVLNKNVKLELVLDIQEGKLRAIPEISAKKPLLKIIPGNLTKESATIEILKILNKEYNLILQKEEIMNCIPANNMEIKKISK
jgi:hypothetical protein